MLLCCAVLCCCSSQDNIKELLQYLVVSYGPRLRALTYVPMFGYLLNKYEQGKVRLSRVLSF